MSQYRLSGSSSRLTSDDAGPSLPSGGGRRGRTARWPGAASLLITLLVAAAVFSALLAACGGSSGGSSSPSSDAQAAAPTPVPSPQITSGVPPAAAVDVVREFWEARRRRTTDGGSTFPGSAWLPHPAMGRRGHRRCAVRRARSRLDVLKPSGGHHRRVRREGVDVLAGSVSPWGDARVHQLFESVVRMSDGRWRIWESGTGP